MNTRCLLMVFFLLFFTMQEVYSQGFSHELGFIFGPESLYSDFGERHNFETNSKNTGFGLGIVHYLNFAYKNDFNIYSKATYFNDHFKIRTELTYHKTELEHYGRWVAPDQKSLFADQLRAMSSSVSIFDIGSQLEFNPLSIRAFQANGNKLMPYLSMGLHWVFFNSEVTSSLGLLNTPVTTPDKYYNSFHQGPGSTFSLSGSVGVRYKLNKFGDLVLDSRWQYYFSDDVDGLNPSLENNGIRPVPENKSNDWTYWLNVGYIYYLN